MAPKNGGQRGKITIEFHNTIKLTILAVSSRPHTNLTPEGHSLDPKI
jgi:hypothetical protein